MTTSTPRADRGPRAVRRTALPGRGRRGGARASGFTLTEVIIAASLSTFVLAGILSTFLLVGRAGFNASAYSEMNAKLRHAVERFHQDVRMAQDVRWQDERRLTLLLPGGEGSAVTYFFEPGADPAGPGRFLRRVGEAKAEVLVDSVAPDFSFRRFRLPDLSGEERAAVNDLETMQLEVRLRAVRTSATNPSASQLATSARCVLRNKNSGT